MSKLKDKRREALEFKKWYKKNKTSADKEFERLYNEIHKSLEKQFVDFIINADHAAFVTTNIDFVGLSTVIKKNECQP